MSHAFNHESAMFGHVDEDTAFVVDDYPYGYTARTQIRYWIETSPRHGDRFVSQTVNPKTGRWNKPKKSTYAPVGVMFAEPATGHIKWAALNVWPKEEWRDHFLAVAGDKLSKHQRAQVAHLIGLERAFKDVEWKIEVNPSAERRAELDAEQARNNAILARRVAVETFGAKVELNTEYGVVDGSQQVAR